MKARARRLAEALAGTFWVVPAAMVLAGIAAGVGLVAVDRSGTVPERLLQSPLIYTGGGTGARTLLGAVASSTIGVAGTVFSITIAALSLAAGQMGPRLLRNFTADRGNQVTLGALLGTFAYALVVLRTVRTHGEGEFVPNVALSVAILLAFVCVAALVFFVGHMAGRINVETVIDLVSRDVAAAMRRLTTRAAQPAPPPAASWDGERPLADGRRGYLQQIDAAALATWAAERGLAIRLLVRPGDFVFPGAPIAFVKGPEIAGVAEAIRKATALGPERVSSADLEFAIRQLVEVAVRALSSGINDPHTALSALDRLGAALCDLVPLHLPSGVHERNGRVCLVIPAITYDGITDAMFHMIRENAGGDAAVLIRLVEVLAAVASCERAPSRLATLARHAALAGEAGRRDIASPADRADFEERLARFEAVRRLGAAALAM